MKWYDQILTGIKTFFSLDHDATESEVHAALQEKGNIETMRTQLTEEITGQITASLQEQFEQQLTQAVTDATDPLLQQIAAADESANALTQQINDLTAQVEALQADLANAHSEAEALKKKAAAEHTNGPTGTDEPKKESAWDRFKQKHKIS